PLCAYSPLSIVSRAALERDLPSFPTRRSSDLEGFPTSPKSELSREDVMSSHTAERAPRRAVSGWFTFALLALGPGALAWAAGSGMPWEGPLEQVVDSI